MAHPTKEKGDLAVALVIADLTKKGYSIFLPLSEHLPFDLIAYDKIINKSYRIQVKHICNGFVRPKTSWVDSNGLHENKYKLTDFDFYGLYLSDIQQIIYPSIAFAGKTISTSIPNCSSSVYWWEDFVTFTSDAEKRPYTFFTQTPKTFTNLIGSNNPPPEKIDWPNNEELKILIWSMPIRDVAKQLGVSDVAIIKRCKKLNIERPKQGFWLKNKK